MIRKAKKLVGKLPELRKAYNKGEGMTRQQLANKAGVSVRTIERLEWGEGQLSIQTLKRLRAVLGDGVISLLDDVVLTETNKGRYERPKKETQDASQNNV